ncbi:VOC family protein [Virgibacillus doumboii]|uniref:VOC family protein n=1 Tax=Virgibacillus doumboii TaxID=2697503 RepID=UPI0013DF7F32|nr:VOC family protein [Virgibacillus doumboii]
MLWFRYTITYMGKEGVIYDSTVDASYRSGRKVKGSVQFYEKTLDARVLNMVTFGDMQGQGFPQALHDNVLHALVRIGESDLMFSDSHEEHSVQQVNNVQMCITTGTTDVANQLFRALKEDAHVITPMEENFVSPAFGMLTDKYGITFTILAKRE